jgi:hypothetical protein
MSCDIEVKNQKTGLSKLIDADKYTADDYTKTFTVYGEAGFDVKIIRGAR